MAYGGFTATKTINVPQAIPLTVVSGGDGSGVTTFTVSTRTAMSVSIVGGHFYDTVAGNSGENETRVLTVEAAGNGWTAPNPLYIKVASGTARLVFTSKKLTKINTVAKAGVNSPIITGTLDNVIDLVVISDGTTAGSNFNTNCTKLVNLVSLDQKQGIVSGTLNNSPNFARLTLVGTAHTLEFNVSLGTVGMWLETDAENCIFTGDLTDIDPTFFYIIGFSNVTADISAWTHCYYLENDCPNITGTTIIGMATCGYFQPNASVFTTAQINQFLADLRANVATVKGYAPSEGTRTFDLRGAVGTGAPTGQGLIDKQWLIDWVGGSGQRNLVDTR